MRKRFLPSSTCLDEANYRLDQIPPDGDPYWVKVRRIARRLHTDHCSKSPDIYVECCDEHDIHWRTGRTIWGRPITEFESNNRLERCMRAKSWMAKLVGVSLAAGLYRAGVAIGALFHEHPKAKNKR